MDELEEDADRGHGCDQARVFMATIRSLTNGALSTALLKQPPSAALHSFFLSPQSLLPPTSSFFRSFFLLKPFFLAFEVELGSRPATHSFLRGE
jgi:hypothetical protein